MLTPEEGEKTNKQKDAIFLPKKKKERGRNDRKKETRGQCNSFLIHH